MAGSGRYSRGSDGDPTGHAAQNHQRGPRIGGEVEPRNRDIVVIGGSAGAIPAVIQIVKALPAGFPAAVFVVIHSSPEGHSVLPKILDRASPLPCQHATDGEGIRRGMIYVARPDHHLLLKPDHIRVSHGPKENNFRPAVDPLFRTAGDSHGPHLIGILLSGGLSDGMHGLYRIKARGGIAIVQNPEEALVASMPLSAIQHVPVDHIVGVDRIAPLLLQLTRETVSVAAFEAKSADDPDPAEGLMDTLKQRLDDPPSPFTCPACGGAMWEDDEGGLLRYRCHVGHGFTAESLLIQQTDRVEDALWVALRVLEDQSQLRRNMAARSRAGGLDGLANAYEQQARAAEERAEVLRGVLVIDEEQRLNPSSEVA